MCVCVVPRNRILACLQTQHEEGWEVVFSHLVKTHIISQSLTHTHTHVGEGERQRKRAREARLERKKRGERAREKHLTA